MMISTHGHGILAEFPRGLGISKRRHQRATAALQSPPCCSHACRSDQPSPRRGHACDASRRARRSRVRRPSLRTTSAPPAETLPDEGLLSILGNSSAARRPAASQPLGGSLATRLAREAGLDRPTQSREMIESERRSQFQRQIYRKWQPGDVYSPSDLSGAEQKKWKQGRKKPQSDAFDQLGINPIQEYKVRCRYHVCGSKLTEQLQNFTIMSEYMTETGRIKHSRDTGLRPKNQRKIAKAIRRAIGLGLMPSVHRHPLVMRKSAPSRFM
jgi:small subunit ribosomal protein S18